MNWKNCSTEVPRVISGAFLAVTILILALTAPSAKAQLSCGDPRPVEGKPNTDTYQTFFLTNATLQNDLNDIQTALRNLMPRAKIYGVPSQNAISLCASPEDLQLAQKVISELDKPKRTYRLTYTITESENGKRTGAQRFVLIVAQSGKTQFKQGSKVPITTGKYDAASALANTEVQYLDVGLLIEAGIETCGDAVLLRSKVGQSSVSEEKSGMGAQDPVILQSSLETTSTLAPGKALALGSLDIPGATRHQEIEVMAELVK